MKTLGFHELLVKVEVSTECFDPSVFQPLVLVVQRLHPEDKMGPVDPDHSWVYLGLAEMEVEVQNCDLPRDDRARHVEVPDLLREDQAHLAVVPGLLREDLAHLALVPGLLREDLATDCHVDCVEEVASALALVLLHCHRLRLPNCLNHLVEDPVCPGL